MFFYVKLVGIKYRFIDGYLSLSLLQAGHPRNPLLIAGRGKAYFVSQTVAVHPAIYSVNILARRNRRAKMAGT
jgi:hypothetical protein